jgi:hypothetical protein
VQFFRQKAGQSSGAALEDGKWSRIAALYIAMIPMDAYPKRGSVL